MKNILLYGSYGYTGALIAEEAQRQKLPIILCGRNEKRLAEQSKALGFPYRVADLSDAASLEKALEQAEVVIHAAGPFHRTYAPMVAACLKTNTHYLDITGEIDVFEGIAAHDAQAKSAQVMLMPGVGFDVVPTDCMAAYLKSKMPEATQLKLAFRNVGSGLSHGTASTMIDGLGQSSQVRRDGKIVPSAVGKATVEADFGRGPVTAVNIPWGDVSTAYYTTGIPNISTYIGISPKAARMMRIGNFFGFIMRAKWVKRLLQKRIDKTLTGPTPEERAKSTSLIWGEIRNEKGETKTARFNTINGYTLTALGALHIANRVLQADFQPGFQTPAGCYGHTLIETLDPEVRWKDL